MGGQWVTSRMLYENGQPTNQITQENMVLQTNGCGVKGTFGEGGSISGSFVGGVANNLIGKWSLGGEEGNFNIQLLDRDKDCANFEGWMIKDSGKREWRWTGHKGAISSQSSCEGECKGRGDHLIWNGKDEYPYCNCICEAGWEFDAFGKNCVPAGTSNANPCEMECRGRDPHQAWNGKDEYPYCNCVCEAGWEFDASGKKCVPAGTSNKNDDAAQALLTTPQGTTSIKPGDRIQITLANGQSMSLEVFCRELQKKISIMSAIYGDDRGKLSMADLSLGMGFISANEYICGNKVKVSYDMATYDMASSGSTVAPSLDIKVELREGPLRLEVVNDIVSLDVETPTATVSSQGMNTFGVAYDAVSRKSKVVAYQYPVEVRPKSGNQTPFTLESSQEVEVGGGQAGPIASSGQAQGEETAQNPGFVPQGSQGGCYADPVTGEIVCVDSYGEPSDAHGEPQGGCYQDPATGQYVCVDSYGVPEGSNEDAQGLCYEDPETGETICVDSSGEPSNADNGWE